MTSVNEILGIKDHYKAPERIMEILKLDMEDRDKYFLKFLKFWNYNLDNDNFRQYFENEHAERKSKKQDFTPFSVGRILAKITAGKKGSRMDVCSGTGSLTIAKWTEDKLQAGFLFYKPSDYFYACYELSDRTVPFLLFNLMIRGMNAVVYHGDVLEQDFKAIYYVLNEEDDALGFSGLMEINRENGNINLIKKYNENI